MDVYSIVLYLHILSFVFWLGTDIGVFTLGKFAQNPAYSISERLLLLKVAMILDLFPRIMMPLTLASGFHLAATLGVLPAGGPFVLWVWLFVILWMAAVFVANTKQDTGLGQTFKKIEKAIQFVLVLGLLWAVISSLVGDGPIQGTWATLKVLFFAATIMATPFLEIAFAPAIAGFIALPEKGSSDDLEASIRRSMDSTYLWVIAIYILVLASAYLGVAKVP